MPEKIRPLAKQQFDFVLDTVGGDILAAALPLISYGGCAAICGNAAGIALNTTVLPFILRGITVAGIDSVNTDMDKRLAIWQRLATDLNVTDMELIQTISLQQASQAFDSLQKGEHTGRTIISFAEGTDAL